MADITVIEGDGGGETEVEAPVIEGEIIEPPSLEPLADASVEVARINADRDITIAAIQAETTETLASQTEALEAERIQWRTERESLLSELAAAREELTTIRTSSIQTTSETAEPDPMNPPSHVNVEGEALAPEAAPEPEPEKPKPRPAHRWI